MFPVGIRLCMKFGEHSFIIVYLSVCVIEELGIKKPEVKSDWGAHLLSRMSGARFGLAPMIENFHLIRRARRVEKACKKLARSDIYH